MRARSIILVTIALSLSVTVCYGQANQLPKEVDAVRRYILEKDYPELFGGTPYRTKIENAIIADLDNDGRAEVIVHFTPHYRQSASLVIYRVSETLQVTRVKEGLAPGPLVPLTGVYLDSHTLGLAVDTIPQFKAGEQGGLRKFAEIALQNFGGVVEYKTFIHTDIRSGNGAYIDMTHLDIPNKSNNCEDFEFSRVLQTTAGQLMSEPTGIHLAALVGANIWLYRVEEFLPSGLLRKSRRVEKTPDDFLEFAPGSGSDICYRSRKGEINPLAFPKK